MTSIVRATLSRSAQTGMVGGRASREQGAVWRVAAALSAGLLGVLLVLAAPGSVEILRQVPAREGLTAGTLHWARPCLTSAPASDHPQLAFCARVDGRVVFSEVQATGETHVLVLGGFHMILVQLPPGAKRPSWGSQITAVGPLLRARDGQREVDATSVRSA